MFDLYRGVGGVLVVVLAVVAVAAAVAVAVAAAVALVVAAAVIVVIAVAVAVVVVAVRSPHLGKDVDVPRSGRQCCRGAVRAPFPPFRARQLFFRQHGGNL